MRQERGELDAAAIGAAHRDSDMIPVDRPCRDRTPTGAGGFQEGADALATAVQVVDGRHRSEEHTSELQSLMRNSYAVFCLKKKNQRLIPHTRTPQLDTY